MIETTGEYFKMNTVSLPKRDIEDILCKKESEKVLIAAPGLGKRIVVIKHEDVQIKYYVEDVE